MRQLVRHQLRLCLEDHRELDSICFIPTTNLGFDRSRSWANYDLTIEQLKDIFEKENRFPQGAIVTDFVGKQETFFDVRARSPTTCRLGTELNTVTLRSYGLVAPRCRTKAKKKRLKNMLRGSSAINRTCSIGDLCSNRVFRCNRPLLTCLRGFLFNRRRSFRIKHL